MPQMYVSLLGTYKLWINTLALEIVEPLKADFYNDVFVNKFLVCRPKYSDAQSTFPAGFFSGLEGVWEVA